MRQAARSRHRRSLTSVSSVVTGAQVDFGAPTVVVRDRVPHVPAAIVNRLNPVDRERDIVGESEIAEAMEGERKNLLDDKLPHRRMAEVELADTLIRIFDYAGEHGYDLEGAYQEKLAYNAQRADHQPHRRLAKGGKRW